MSTGNNVIVITTINRPTEAVTRFAGIPGSQLVVVGDTKTPDGWKCENAVFLGMNGPESDGFTLNALLPFNHYCRKMIGYLYAMKSGAHSIVDTDDDNIPKHGWSFPAGDGVFDCTPDDMGFVNVYKYFTDKHIWPRGLPLRFINRREAPPGVVKRNARIGVWQGLADEDPDVDAIYRLISDAPCCFEDREPVALAQGTITPFNSQNTMFRRELFALLYLPATVTFRFTDILRSYVSQPIMWLNGFCLGFTNATVVQKRNPHDYFGDFLSEIPMYQHAERVIDVVRGAIASGETITGNLRRAYDALRRTGIVPDGEMRVLDSWLEDIQRLRV